MKKTFWLALILLLVCVFAFSSCDSEDTPPTNNENNQQTTDNNNQNTQGSGNNASGTPTECQHTFGSWNTVKQATCKEEGKLVRTCAKCFETEESTVSKTDVHTEVIDAAVSATCTVDGKTEGKHCSVCGKIIVSQTVVKASGHTEVIDLAVGATCEKEGKTEGKHCSVCSTVIVKQNSINKASHNYKNGACTMCKAVDTVAKQAEIDAENERHEAKLAQIENYYPNVISGLQERINNLKDAYGITYVYSDSYCYDKISSLTTEIRNLERKIASLSGSTNSSDVAERRRYEAQLTQKQNEQDMYYKCITINGLSNEITNTRSNYVEAVNSENNIHSANLLNIQDKYKCYEEKHNIKICESQEASCEEDGITEGVYCEDCKKYLVPQTIISSIGHSIDNSTGICRVCNTNISEIGFVFEWSDYYQAYIVMEYVGTDSNIIVPSQYKGKDVAVIGDTAFNNCTHIISVIVPSSIKQIYRGAFSGCSSLQSITLPFVGDMARTEEDSVHYTFGYIFGTSSYVGGVKTQQHNFYYDLAENYYIPASLRNVTITGGQILGGEFANCSTITSISLPDDITSIGAGAFQRCTSLENFIIGDKVTYIGASAFYRCESLVSIVIPRGVKSIANDTFGDCTNLSSIVFPNSIENIEIFAFLSCSNLSYVYYEGTKSEWSAISIADYNNSLSDATICYYSENKPVENNTYWHYVDGIPAIWGQED